MGAGRGPAGQEFWHSEVAPGARVRVAAGDCCRKSLPCPAGLAVALQPLGPSRFRSESVGAGSRHCAREGGEWVPMLRRLRPEVGRLNSASSLDVQVCFRPAGRAVGRDVRREVRAVARAGVTPCPAAPPGRVRISGGPRARRGGGSVRGALNHPAAGCRSPGDWECQSSPRSAAFHLGRGRVDVRVGLLMPKATKGLFKLEAQSAADGPLRGGEAGPWGLPCVRVNLAARVHPAESSKATAVSKHTAAANRCWFLSRKRWPTMLKG